MICDRPPPEGALALPPHLNAAAAEDLRAALVLALDGERPPALDAAATLSIGQAGLQLLLAAQAEQPAVRVHGASEGLAGQISALLALTRPTASERARP